MSLTLAGRHLYNARSAAPAIEKPFWLTLGWARPHLADLAASVAFNRAVVKFFFFPNTTSPSRRCWTLGWPRRWRGLVAIKTTSPSRGCRTLGWPSRPWPRCRQFFKTTSPSRGCWTLGWPRWPLKTGRCLWRAVLACHHLIGADAPARTLALTSLKAAPAPWRGFRNKFFVVCFFYYFDCARACPCTWLTFARPLTLVFFFFWRPWPWLESSVLSWPKSSYFLHLHSWTSRVAQWIARWAHKPEVRGSKPRSVSLFLVFFLVWRWARILARAYGWKENHFELTLFMPFFIFF